MGYNTTECTVYWEQDCVQALLSVSLSKTVHLQGRHAGADNPTRAGDATCQTTSLFSITMICCSLTVKITVMYGRRLYLSVCLSVCLCVFTPKPMHSLHPRSLWSCLTGDIWSSSGDICAICIHSRVRACYMTCETESWRNNTNSACRSILDREAPIIENCQSINETSVCVAFNVTWRQRQRRI